MNDIEETPETTEPETQISKLRIEEAPQAELKSEVNTAEITIHDQEALTQAREQLKDVQNEEKKGLAQKYNGTPAVYGESAGTSATFLKEREEMGTLRAINRLAARSGIFAETGDDSIISGELPDKVPLKTRMRGAIVVGLSAPQMVVLLRVSMRKNEMSIV